MTVARLCFCKKRRHTSGVDLSSIIQTVLPYAQSDTGRASSSIVENPVPRKFGQTVSDSGGGQQQTRPVSGSVDGAGTNTTEQPATTAEPTATQQSGDAEQVTNQTNEEQTQQSTQAPDNGAFSLPENNTEISEVGKEIKSLFHQAVSGELSGKPVAVGRLTQQGKAFLEELSGLSFKTNIDFVLNPSDLNHIYRDHYGKNEKDKGNNIPLNDGDIEMMASVIYQPDAVVLSDMIKKHNQINFSFSKERTKGHITLLKFTVTSVAI